MKTSKSSAGSVLITVAMVACASILGAQLWNYYMKAPWTRDGHVHADVVGIVPDVSGLVTDIYIEDNQQVAKNNILFKIDPVRYQAALEQAKANVLSAQAAFEIAKTNLERDSALVQKNVVSVRIVQNDEATLEQARATLAQAEAAENLAQINLDRSTVRAPASGQITNFQLRPGDYATAGSPVAVLIDRDTLHVDGYFEETKLSRIHIGDRVQIQLMGEPKNIEGYVESIAGGIQDQERSDSPGELAKVSPTFSWVRLAQRVPVRIALVSTTKKPLVVGQTATVSIVETRRNHKAN